MSRASEDKLHGMADDAPALSSKNRSSSSFPLLPLDMSNSDRPAKRRKAIVVGAGVGGVSTAARLAHAGLDVEVYEKNAFSGGRCSVIHHDGYRFDQVRGSVLYS